MAEKSSSLAEKATKETGVKTVFFIPDPRREEGDRFYFVASFNSRGMNDKEKIKMIEKAIDTLEKMVKEV